MWDQFVDLICWFWNDLAYSQITVWLLTRRLLPRFRLFSMTFRKRLICYCLLPKVKPPLSVLIAYLMLVVLVYLVEMRANHHKHDIDR
jgi:hypothetical protein